MSTGRTQLSIDQVAEIQGIAEELREHSSHVEEVLKSSMLEQEKSAAIKEHFRLVVRKATLLLVLCEEQAEAYERTGLIDVAALRGSCAELRTWIDANEETA